MTLIFDNRTLIFDKSIIYSMGSYPISRKGICWSRPYSIWRHLSSTTARNVTMKRWRRKRRKRKVGRKGEHQDRREERLKRRRKMKPRNLMFQNISVDTTYKNLAKLKKFFGFSKFSLYFGFVRLRKIPKTIFPILYIFSKTDYL
nr:hypothetical protein DLTAUQXX_DLTAUQXX_CDS_0052 [uncultured phage]CAI9750148.1 hypothetical protein LUIDIZRK_LUIDIZRK_CDS_0052 [uncultured phage]